MSDIRTDWIKGKKASTLRASLAKESLHLKKLTSSFESMKLINDKHLKHKQRIIKENLAKLTSVSTSGISSVSKPKNDTLSITECKEQENSETNSTTLPILMSSNHLLKHFNLSQQKRLSNTGKKGKNYVPFSKTDLTKTASASGPPNALPRITSDAPATSDPYRGRSGSLRRSQDLSRFSIPNAILKFPSVHRLSVERLQYGTKSGCLDFEKRIKEMAINAWEEEEEMKRSTMLPNIQPNEFLSCRYLRLSENNIATLLQQCKDSGTHIDIHPHMKETDIDIDTLMSTEKQNSSTDASCL